MTEEEQQKWEEADPSDRDMDFIPKKFDNLRSGLVFACASVSGLKQLSGSLVLPPSGSIACRSSLWAVSNCLQSRV